MGDLMAEESPRNLLQMVPPHSFHRFLEEAPRHPEAHWCCGGWLPWSQSLGAVFLTAWAGVEPTYRRLSQAGGGG